MMRSRLFLLSRFLKFHFNHKKTYLDVSIQDERAGECVPSLDLNLYSPLPLRSSILSAELCVIPLALDVVIDYSIVDEDILCLSNSRSAILLLKN